MKEGEVNEVMGGNNTREVLRRELFGPVAVQSNDQVLLEEERVPSPKCEQALIIIGGRSIQRRFIAGMMSCLANN